MESKRKKNKQVREIQQAPTRRELWKRKEEESSSLVWYQQNPIK